MGKERQDLRAQKRANANHLYELKMHYDML